MYHIIPSKRYGPYESNISPQSSTSVVYCHSYLIEYVNFAWTVGVGRGPVCSIQLS